MAAVEAIRKAGPDASGSFGWNPELLPHQSADGRCGGGERQHQKSAETWPRLQEPALPSAEGPAHGRDQNRICGFRESSLKCGTLRILAQSHKTLRPGKRKLALTALAHVA